MISGRAGLVMDTGSKVTYNGVEIGRVSTVSAAETTVRRRAHHDERQSPVTWP